MPRKRKEKSDKPSRVSIVLNVLGEDPFENRALPVSYIHSLQPLSAYNFFFQQQREKILEQVRLGLRAKPAFADMSKWIAAQWKETGDSERVAFEEMAAKDKRRYGFQIIEWRQRQHLLYGTNAESESFHSSEVEQDGAQEAEETGDVMSQAIHLPALSAESQNSAIGAIQGNAQDFREDVSTKATNPLPTAQGHLATTADYGGRNYKFSGGSMRGTTIDNSLFGWGKKMPPGSACTGGVMGMTSTPENYHHAASHAEGKQPPAAQANMMEVSVSAFSWQGSTSDGQGFSGQDSSSIGRGKVSTRLEAGPPTRLGAVRPQHSSTQTGPEPVGSLAWVAKELGNDGVEYFVKRFRQG